VTKILKFLQQQCGDVAAAHGAGIESSVKVNQRCLVGGGEYAWQKVHIPRDQGFDWRLEIL
jgi:hypothetical protein